MEILALHSTVDQDLFPLSRELLLALKVCIFELYWNHHGNQDPEMMLEYTTAPQRMPKEMGILVHEPRT